MRKYIKIYSLILAVIMLAGLLTGCSAENSRDVIDSIYELLELFGGTGERTEPEHSLPSQGQAEAQPANAGEEHIAGDDKQDTAQAIDEDGEYTTKEDVALYIYTYGHLPSNFITKSEAQALGWTGGSLEKYAPGKSIGGDRFGNREGLLPKATGRRWTECDINTMGASSRGAERVVFSNDGLIYYTGDHYESFELLYGKP